MDVVDFALTENEVGGEAVVSLTEDDVPESPVEL
jgi:hypothetical protein